MSSTTDSDFRVSLLQRQLELAFARLPPVLCLFPFVGLLVWLPLRHAVAPTAQYVWFALLAGLAAAGLGLARAFRRGYAAGQFKLWEVVRVALAVANGLTWGGYIALYFFVAGDNVLENFVLFVVACTSIMSLLTASTHRKSLFAFQLANVAPLLLRLLFEGSREQLTMAGLLLAFLVTLLLIGVRIGQSSDALLLVEAKNQRLVTDLLATQRELENANATLHVKVAEGKQELSFALQEKAAREQQLRQSERMEAIGRVAGGVAHDFNNILTGISGLASVVHDTFDPGDERRDDMAEILGATQRATKLTQELLGFAKGGLTEPRHINLPQHIVRLEKMLRRMVPDNIELCWLLPEEALWLFLDPGQLNQLVVNLVAHARDSMPNGGALTIQMAREASRQAAAPQTDRTEVNTPELFGAVLRVTDSGPGISAEEMEHIFEPFLSPKVDRRASLGLATCFGIVTRAGGSIHVTSEVGKGTTFEAHFPLASNVPLEVVEKDSERDSTTPVPATPRRGTSVLIVDDQPIILKVVARALQTQGYQIYQAVSAEQALAQVITRGIDPDLVLTDVVLPHMSGIDLREALIKHGSKAKFLMMSGYIDDVNLKRKDTGDSIALLTKPFSTSQLLQAVSDVLGPAQKRGKLAHLKSV